MIALTIIPGHSDASQTFITEWATAEDCLHADTLTHEKRRHEYLLSRSAQRALLTHVTGDKDWKFGADSRGKPYAINMTGKTAPHISWSHSHELVACAVSSKWILGLDIEYWRPRDFTALASYAFGPDEQNEVAHGGLSSFYRIWTMREAISKMTGDGLRLAANAKDYVAGGASTGCWATDKYRLFYTSPRPDYSLALATRSEDIWTEEMLRWVDVTTQR